ncbi:DUF1176 domain-containing protein [Brevundimonas sp. A19_0]|uniref:DUF1176 domain-containing protein n=1 Tax=Brevundimonas sp. A19_0 TaxID=2821087 RepID=UPI001AD9F99D|nr:DUF1176 domain-containing protein [Brevundimonas sp. A19_0]MBO9501032.1 DUF1176 domain-containing protein [Brevundimonas sp. A19_0]
MRRTLLASLGVSLIALLGACQGEPEGQTNAGTEAPADGAAAPSPTPAAATARPETRAFRDWSVVCGNDGTCTAFGGMESGTGWLRIVMPAGPEAVPVVEMGMGMNAEILQRTLTLDGRAYGLDVRDNVARVAAERARALIAALAGARTAAIGTGEDTLEFSVSGVSAALLWIDERQGRLDTVTALIRKGDAPAARVPAAPALPIVTPAPAVAQTGMKEGTALPDAVEAMARVRECRGDTDFSPDFQSSTQQYRLDADTVLWGVPCFMGTYNTGYLYALTDSAGASPRIVSLPTTGEAMETPINPDYDPATRRLSAFGKGRGIGDCGTVHEWVWTARGFVLARESEMERCFGVTPDLWPLTWDSRTPG